MAITSIAPQVPAQDATLDDLQRRAVRFFLEQTHPETGLTKDRAANFKETDEYVVASSASTGFALGAFVIGAERGWIPKEEARRRTHVTLRGIYDKLPHERGWGYHFIHWATGERMWKSEASSIDTGILLAGVLIARNYFRDDETKRLAQRYLDRIDWNWMLTDGGKRPDEVLFSMGWHPPTDPNGGGFIDGRWGLRTYDECKMLYVMAYGASDVTTKGWNAMRREEHVYNGIPFITGGPLFLHQMSEGFFRFKDRRDELGYDYWVASRNAALANRAYCVDNPKGMKGYGPRLWGLSASDYPDGYSAFGAPGWTEDNGTVTPTAAVASVYWLPKEGREIADAIRAGYPKSYGRYGYSNALNPQRDWIGPDVIGIDLGMMLLNVENARTGLIHKLTNADPVVQRGMKRIGFKPAKSTPASPLRSQ